MIKKTKKRIIFTGEISLSALQMAHDTHLKQYGVKPIELWLYWKDFIEYCRLFNDIKEMSKIKFRDTEIHVYR